LSGIILLIRHDFEVRRESVEQNMPLFSLAFGHLFA
jgi:hypothetical protein